ncbi:MAG: Endonuclease III [Verrucomicrobia bacterium ADurb.Bin474]|nr:MAG: Endonuclease III [Verrucomicrobia bacterium ADurb.Bin474]
MPADLPRLGVGVLRELLDGGQTFHWNRVLSDPAERWVGWISDQAFQVALSLDGTIRVRALGSGNATEYESRFTHWIIQETDFQTELDRLPWRSDSHLERCICALPGLRVLRQDPATALLAFIISANKQIPQIKAAHRKLALRFGESAFPGFNRPPGWDVLSKLSLEDWKSCGVGYRAPYLMETARRVVEDPGIFQQMDKLDYPSARARLMEFPGVGGKVADCVLLYGCHRQQAFPLDTWIRRVMTDRYSLSGWTDAQILHFASIHFGAAAGLAQQYLFAWERRQPRSS